VTQEESFTGVKGAASGGLLGLSFQLGSQVQGHLGDLTLQGRFGQQRRFRHVIPSTDWATQATFYLTATTNARDR
jgi:hypothetical protein